MVQATARTRDAHLYVFPQNGFIFAAITFEFPKLSAALHSHESNGCESAMFASNKTTYPRIVRAGYFMGHDLWVFKIGFACKRVANH